MIRLPAMTLVLSLGLALVSSSAFAQLPAVKTELPSSSVIRSRNASLASSLTSNTSAPRSAIAPRSRSMCSIWVSIVVK